MTFFVEADVAIELFFEQLLDQLQFGTHSYGTQRINPDNSGNPLNFPLTLPPPGFDQNVAEKQD